MEHEEAMMAEVWRYARQRTPGYESRDFNELPRNSPSWEIARHWTFDLMSRPMFRGDVPDWEAMDFWTWFGRMKEEARRQNREHLVGSPDRHWINWNDGLTPRQEISLFAYLVVARDGNPS